MRQLASIQRVVGVHPIDGADAIECIQVLGWQLVAKKGEFKVGDLCVYCEVDSVLPERPEFEFLRAKKFRIKTIRLKGQISQGIAFPLDVIGSMPGCSMELRPNGLAVFTFPEGGLPWYPCPVGMPNLACLEGADVSDVLGVTKWEPKEEDEGLMVNGQPVRSKKKGEFPDWISKTDETRIQSVPQVLVDAQGTLCYISEKLDGSSFTAYLKLDKDTGEFKFGVCSRNQEKLEDEFCHFWAIARKLDLEGKMRKAIAEHMEVFPDGLAIQGELVGPGIQKNRLKLAEHDLFLYNVFNITTGKFFSYAGFVYLAERALGLKMCPILDDNFTIDENTTVQSLVDLATRKSALCPTAEAEGIVVRPVVEGHHRKLGRFSFKAINPEFLLKHGA